MLATETDVNRTTVKIQLIILDYNIFQPLFWVEGGGGGGGKLTRIKQLQLMKHATHIQPHTRANNAYTRV